MVLLVQLTLRLSPHLHRGRAAMKEILAGISPVHPNNYFSQHVRFRLLGH